MSVEFGALALRSVHPASPDLLTKYGPLGARRILCRASSLKQLTLPTHLEFENRLRMFHPQGL